MRIRKGDSSDDKQIRQIAKMSDALAHPARIALFRYTMKRNTARESVRNKDLVAAFPYTQATISQHMNKLIISGLIEARQEGTSTYYYANIGMLSQYIELLRIFD